MPEFDVVATGDGLVTVPIQVKASNGSSWQTSLDRWLDVEYDARRRKHVLHGKRRIRNLDLIFVFVALSEKRGDRFLILPQARVRELVYRSYLARMEPPADPGRFTTTLESMRSQLTQLRKERREARERLQKLRGELDPLRAIGVYPKLCARS